MTVNLRKSLTWVFVFGAVVVWSGSLSVQAAAPRSSLGSVEVQVEVTEIDHAKASQVGVNWTDEFGFLETLPSKFGEIGAITRTTPIQATLHLMIQEGAAELLANPNLITDSGTTATFKAGGEIPYITSTSLGSSNVEFKPYGVLLEVSPTIEPGGRIALSVKAAVSAPDQTNGVNLSGNSVPGLQERVVTSHVTVQPGTTITLAGLVQTFKEETVKGVPVLRKIPLVGMFFRWKKVNFRRTSVVVFMTPNIKNF